MKQSIVGLAKFAHPAILAEHGSTNIDVGADSPFSVAGAHYFVALVVNRQSLIMAPCFSRPGMGRIEVPSAFRKGHPGWTQKPCFVNFKQLWLVPVDALQIATHVVNDRSSFDNPNLIDPGWLLRAWGNFLIQSVE